MRSLPATRRPPPVRRTPAVSGRAASNGSARSAALRGSPGHVPRNVLVAKLLILVQGQDIDTQKIGDDVLEFIERIDGDEVRESFTNCDGTWRSLQEAFEFLPEMLHG